jgi:toxin ParE1/3/4
MKLVEWSEDSIFSMQSIYDYIFTESPQNADLVIDTLFDLGEKLNIFPKKTQKSHCTTLTKSDSSQSGTTK